MNNESISVKVRSIVAEVLALTEISEDASQENTPEWDSMAYISIVSVLEDEYEIEVNEDNIDDFGSIEKILTKVLNCKL
jgi:acyl carrier protein